MRSRLRLAHRQQRKQQQYRSRRQQWCRVFHRCRSTLVVCNNVTNFYLLVQFKFVVFHTLRTSLKKFVSHVFFVDGKNIKFNWIPVKFSRAQFVVEIEAFIFSHVESKWFPFDPARRVPGQADSLLVDRRSFDLVETQSYRFRSSILYSDRDERLYLFFSSKINIREAKRTETIFLSLSRSFSSTPCIYEINGFIRFSGKFVIVLVCLSSKSNGAFFLFSFQRNKLRFERILRTANRPEILLKEMTVSREKEKAIFPRAK